MRRECRTQVIGAKAELHTFIARDLLLDQLRPASLNSAFARFLVNFTVWYNANAMRKVLFNFIFTLFIVGFCQLASFAQLNEDGRWKSDLYYEPAQLNYQSYSESDFANALTKLKVIKSENSSSVDEWAGDYSAQSGEVNIIALRFSQQAGFVHLNFYTCLPELRGLNYGTVTGTPDYILLTSQTSQRNGKATKYLPVKWGERHYLVPESEVAQFYKFVAGYGWKKDEYVFFDFLLKNDDAEKPIVGMPVFPRGYEQFVKKPIEATITEVLRREIKTEQSYDGSPAYESHTFVKLNVGSINGVKRGTTLNVLESEDYEKVDIVQVGKRSSIGVVVRSLDENKQETFKNYRTNEIKTYPKVSVGWQLSTRSLLLINNGA